MYDLHKRGLRPISYSLEDDKTDEQQAKLEHFITAYDEVMNYIHSLNHAFNTNLRIMDAVPESEKIPFLNELSELGKLVEEHLCDEKLALFMIREKGLLLANLDTFMESDAKEKMQLIFCNANKIKINHPWIPTENLVHGYI